jgi:hypothetical protein
MKFQFFGFARGAPCWDRVVVREKGVMSLTFGQNAQSTGSTASLRTYPGETQKCEAPSLMCSTPRGDKDGQIPREGH